MFLRILVTIFAIQVFNGVLCFKDCKSDTSIKIKEDLSINDTVCTFSGVPAERDLQILSGNTNFRFQLNYVEEFWHLRVAKLLDYGIWKEFTLKISSHDDQDGVDAITVNIILVNVNSWPRKFNYSCSNIVKRAENENTYPFEVDADLKAPFIGGKYSLSSSKPKNTGIDMDNDQCNMRIFKSASYENNFIAVGDILDEFDPSKDIQCTSLSPGDKNKLPSIKIWRDPQNKRPQNPIINPDWFHHGAGKVGILIDVDFQSVYTDMISKWNCSVSTKLIIQPVIASLNIFSTGCPEGKYGGKCDKDCICKNNGTCHPFNGACDCAPGWKAPDCTVDYQAVDIAPKRQVKHYGDELELTCKSYHVNANDVTIEWYFNSAPIMRQSNVQITSTPGQSVLFIPRMKDNSEGTYKCIGKLRDSTTPIVYEDYVHFAGCNHNLYGETCNKECNCEHDRPCDRYKGCICDGKTYWGDTCGKPCQCENNATCAKEDGACDCKDWTWGRNCQKNCDCAEGASSCHPGTGECSCFLGWNGDRCDFDLRKPAFIAGMTVTGIVLLIAILAVLVKYRRRTKYRKITDEKPLSTSVLMDEEDDLY